MRRPPRVIVAGGGIGGLTAAAELAAHGAEVTLLERGAELGGKLRQVTFAGRPIDVGPTVLTMRWVFEQIFTDLGTRLAEEVRLRQSEILARHAWTDGSRLDLYADLERSTAAIADFAGAREAKAFRAFVAQAAKISAAAERTFILLPSPTLREMGRATGLAGMRDFVALDGLRSMARALSGHFADERLRQLFGRYATYYGSSPYAAPATLNLIAHVELAGVWLVDGGMANLARALARLATARGATLRTGVEVGELIVRGGRVAGVRLADEELDADAVVFNGDVAALGAGALGPAARGSVRPTSVAERSLSALTLATLAPTSGLTLAPHNVFFWRTDYAREFHDIFARGRLPEEPTVYIRAQDRDGKHAGGPERLFLIINAPARGDVAPFGDVEVHACLERAFSLLERCGLRVDRQPEREELTTPNDFARFFPHTGGAIYGRATHSMWAPLQRTGARTRLPGLYLASGSGHPGAGVPMAALGGRQAAAALLTDFGLTGLSAPTGMHGGTSTR